MAGDSRVVDPGLMARWRAIENVRIAWRDYLRVLNALVDNLKRNQTAKIPEEMHSLQFKLQHDLFWRGITTEIVQDGEAVVLIRTEKAA